MVCSIYFAELKTGVTSEIRGHMVDASDVALSDIRNDSIFRVSPNGSQGIPLLTLSEPDDEMKA
jgi:hypothetical protein